MTEPKLPDRRAQDEAMMAELRANAGKNAAGRVLVILHTTGAKSGHRHQKPMCVREDGPDLIVVASAGGQSRHPQWYPNLVANPDVTVEYKGEKFEATASTEPNSPNRDRLFQSMSEEIPDLYGYQDRCREYRQIPLVRLKRK